MPPDITERVRARGDVTFADFMRWCLHDPQIGYYATRVPGPGADFETAPTLSPLYGRCLVRCLESMWQASGRADPFTVTEVGGGGADLADSVLRSALPSFAAALKWRFVEPHDAIAEVQRARVPGAVRVRSLDDVPYAAGVVVANEVLDSLPVHLLEMSGSELCELYVSASTDGLSFTQGPVSDPRLTAELQARGISLEDGQRVELSLEAGPLVTAMSDVSPYMVVIDYGDVRPGLHLDRPSGSLLAYRGGMPLDDPLARPGRQDLTAHVDFTLVADAAASAGMRTAWYGTQRDFLIRWGLREDLEDLRVRACAATGAEALALHALRSQASVLTRSMSGFRVWVGARDVPDPEP